MKRTNVKLKHNLVKIKDLIGQFNVPVMFKEVNIPKFTCAGGTYGGIELPERTVLEVVNKLGSAQYDKVMVYIQYVNKGMKNYISSYLPLETEVMVLTGSMGKKMLKDHNKGIINRLNNMLYFEGMIGADPEIFVEDGSSNQMIPAYEFLGSKKNTKVVTYEGKPIYWDGFQAEFETSPRNCNDEHTASVGYGLAKLNEVAKKFNPNAKLSTQTVMLIHPDLLSSAKEEHVSLGCMPSFNAYGEEEVTKVDPRKLPFRSAGGHLHFGCGKRTKEAFEPIVKGLDAILGVACVALFQKYDDPARRKMYGRAGEYRTPPHGLEYRVLSNAWLFHPTITYLTFDIGRKVFKFAELKLMDNWNATEKEVRDCINNCDVELAQKILKRNEEVFCKIIQAAYQGATKDQVKGLYNLFFNGMHTVIDTTDIVKNWGITGLYPNTGVRRVSNNFNKIARQEKIA